MTDATQTELLEQAKERAVMDVRVSMPARIVSFDPATKTAQVEILLKMVDDADEAIDYPPLTDCPCVFTRGGGFHVVHPYKAGDNGLVLFSDRCLDGWFESGQAAAPMDYRIHSMSDAYFIGGADNMTNVSPIPSNAMFIGKDDNSAGLQINSDGSVILKGASFTIEPVTNSNGVINTGTVASTQDVTAGGKSMMNHIHGGVDRGDSTTDGPQ